MLQPEAAAHRATLDALAALRAPPACGFFHECMKGEAQFSLGFMKPSPIWNFGHTGSFGTPGAAGSLGYADPQTGIAYAYVTNRIGTRITADRRDPALRAALERSLQAAARHENQARLKTAVQRQSVEAAKTGSSNKSA